MSKRSPCFSLASHQLRQNGKMIPLDSFHLFLEFDSYNSNNIMMSETKPVINYVHLKLKWLFWAVNGKNVQRET